MQDSKSIWGDSETRFFYELTPERILTSVEAALGQRMSGRVLALNSMENRVYEIERELDDQPKDPSERFVIAKFYRPGRWSEQQLRDEHRFLADLAEHEIPVVAPLLTESGDTLSRDPESGLFYAVFPKVGGRSPSELSDEDLAQCGRLLARMHGVGAARTAPNRLVLSPETLGRANLDYLASSPLLPDKLKASYLQTAEQLLQLVTPWFAGIKSQRIHGDCHMGNLLQGRRGLYFVDFDDMFQGPTIQDLWLILPARDEDGLRSWNILLEGYEQMRAFDQRELRLVEPLRALRFIHFAAWLSKRWGDPAFPRAFPHFGSDAYWQGQIQDLREQLAMCQQMA